MLKKNSIPYYPKGTIILFLLWILRWISPELTQLLDIGHLVLLLFQNTDKLFTFFIVTKYLKSHFSILQNEWNYRFGKVFCDIFRIIKFLLLFATLSISLYLKGFWILILIFDFSSPFIIFLLFFLRPTFTHIIFRNRLFYFLI